MGPYVRIILRYAVGAVIGYQIGVATAGAAAVVGVVTEGVYALARRWGWRT